MVIQVTTRQLLNMLKEAYERGAVEEAVKDKVAENLDGKSREVAQLIFNKHQWDNDYILQQS